MNENPFRILLLPLVILYRLIYKFHHFFFLKPQKKLTHAKLIVIGSFCIGGAGKTPFVIWITNKLINLYESKKIAILCHQKATDESKLLKKKIPMAWVFVSSNRYKTACQLDRDFDYIICDDGFEDNRLNSNQTIRLDWDMPPHYLKDLWPIGNNRSLWQDHKKPDIILKCGGDNPDIKFSISEIINGEQKKLKVEDSKIWAICGIGNPNRFFKDLENFGVKVWEKTVRPDHDGSFDKWVRRIIKKSAYIVMTEKDYVRLKEDLQKNPQVYYCVQKMDIKESKEKLIFYNL